MYTYVHEHVLGLSNLFTTQFFRLLKQNGRGNGGTGKGGGKGKERIDREAERGQLPQQCFLVLEENISNNL